MSGECAPWAHVHTAGTYQRGRQELEKVVDARVGVKLEFQNAHEAAGSATYTEPGGGYEAEATVHQHRGS